MPTTRSGEGIGFQDKDTINLEELSNTNGYLPMVQSGINYKVRPTELKRDAVAVCSTASATVEKTATVNNMPDFVLVNGTVITVYFENKNTAAEPTLNINNTGSWPLKLPNQANNVVIGSGCWNDGFIAEVKYVEISDNNKFFLLLGHNVASTNNNYTTLADGTTIYTKPQIDNNVVKYTSQTLSDNQKTQARSNINACSNSDSRLSNSRTPTAHNQASNTINAMTGYSKPSSTSAIATTDTLNSAIGKLEKALENSSKGTVTSVAVKMNGATKGTVTSSGTIDLGTVLTAHQSLDGYIKESAKSIGNSGYLKLTNGLLIHYGSVTTDSNGGKDITFNPPFANSNYSVLIGMQYNNLPIAVGYKNNKTASFCRIGAHDSGIYNLSYFFIGQS